MRAPLFILAAFALGSLPAKVRSVGALRQPFAPLREAYHLKDAGKAAEVYTEDAKIVLRYPGMPPEEYVGTAAICQTVAQMLQPVNPE